MPNPFELHVLPFPAYVLLSELIREASHDLVPSMILLSASGSKSSQPRNGKLSRKLFMIERQLWKHLGKRRKLLERGGKNVASREAFDHYELRSKMFQNVKQIHFVNELQKARRAARQYGMSEDDWTVDSAVLHRDPSDAPIFDPALSGDRRDSMDSDLQRQDILD
ncbi:hypothetical protein EJ08DRAFT_656378 [Tothia fuscella]|uniref:Uncharacterized protein n=1 Tax=Tothia fuscella TaxID=1048955 RepID=A0A9P4P151_9PEZI|nr:hypothetical protein EJ08DRAFT_656378 [Tothia fuscella]